MTADSVTPSFDQLADVYWRLGVMQAPSQLHGYLIGRLSSGEALPAEQWLSQAVAYIDAVQSPDQADAALLMSLYVASNQSLASEELGLQLLLPEDAVEITQRADALGQWCQGYLAGFAQGGKWVKEHHGQQAYPAEVSEALNDIAAISQISLGEDDQDLQQSEQNLFEVAEYLRVAAVTIYVECSQQLKPSSSPASPVASAKQPAAGSAAGLFSSNKKQLH